MPTCVLDLLFYAQAFDTYPIVDGSSIEVTIQNADLNINETYNFGVYNIEEIKQNQQFLTMRITGVVDFYSGYIDGNILNSYCNTYEIFNKVADDCKLKKDIDMTNDKQLWVAGEKNVYDFLTYLTQHAYIDDTSGMFWCLTANNTILFKNISNILKNVNDAFIISQVTGYDPQNKTYNYTSADLKVESGFCNVVEGGYGGKDFYFDLEKYEQQEADSRIVISANKMINISKNLSQGLQNSYLPLNIGNYHPNYYNAYKQNIRTLSTLSIHAYLLCQTLQPFKLGELVKFVYSDSQELDTGSKILSGNYIITKKHIEIQKETVICDLQLSTTGFNAKSPVVETY